MPWPAATAAPTRRLRRLALPTTTRRACGRSSASAAESAGGARRRRAACAHRCAMRGVGDAATQRRERGNRRWRRCLPARRVRRIDVGSVHLTVVIDSVLFFCRRSSVVGRWCTDQSFEWCACVCACARIAVDRWCSVGAAARVGARQWRSPRCWRRAALPCRRCVSLRCRDAPQHTLRLLRALVRVASAASPASSAAAAAARQLAGGCSAPRHLGQQRHDERQRRLDYGRSTTSRPRDARPARGGTGERVVVGNDVRKQRQLARDMPVDRRAAAAAAAAAALRRCRRRAALTRLRCSSAARCR